MSSAPQRWGPCGWSSRSLPGRGLHEGHQGPSGTFMNLLVLVSGPRRWMIGDQKAYGFCLALGGQDPGRTE